MKHLLTIMAVLIMFSCKQRDIKVSQKQNMVSRQKYIPCIVGSHKARFAERRLTGQWVVFNSDSALEVMYIELQRMSHKIDSLSYDKRRSIYHYINN